MTGVKENKKRCYCKKTVIYFLVYSLIFNTSLPAVLALEASDIINQTGVIGSQHGAITQI